MKESMTYQKILADGMAEGIAKGRAEGITTGITTGERTLFLKFARRRLGEPDEARLAVVEAATTDKIEFWMEEVLKVESWAELIPL